MAAKKEFVLPWPVPDQTGTTVPPALMDEMDTVLAVMHWMVRRLLDAREAESVTEQVVEPEHPTEVGEEWTRVNVPTAGPTVWNVPGPGPIPPCAHIEAVKASSSKLLCKFRVSCLVWLIHWMLCLRTKLAVGTGREPKIAMDMGA